MKSADDNKELPRKSLVNFQIAGLAVFAAGFALIHFAPGHMAAIFVRCAGLVLLAYAVIRRRSLTFWIFFSMLLGLEVGLDLPNLATQTHFLSDIFLRLIKVIIAPLLFSVLVVGIAGHADLKKVGRLGIKSLVYFEIVSTIAMAIGYAAIHLSRAGEGVHLPSSVSQQSLNLVPHSATQLIIDIFPENIAKSIADGQVLQIVVFSVIFATALILVPEAKRKPLLTFAE